MPLDPFAVAKEEESPPLPLSSLALQLIQQHFHFSIRHFPSSFPLAATAAVKCLKHQRRTKIAFSLRLVYASLRWSTSSFCPFAVAVQKFFAFAVDGVLGILARDPASTTHPRRSFIMLPGPRRDERHAHLIMCIYSEINFYFGQKKKKKNGKTDAKRKSFMSLAALHWQLAKVKQKRKRERRMGNGEKSRRRKWLMPIKVVPKNARKCCHLWQGKAHTHHPLPPPLLPLWGKARHVS